MSRNSSNGGGVRSSVALAIRLTFFFALGGWILLVRPQLNAGPAGVVLRVALFAIRYIVSWAAVWLVIWWLSPSLLVASRTGLQTLFQVLPATIVAVLVLVLGSVFVIAQTATSTWGTRAAVMISLDQQVVEAVARPLLLLIATLLLSGQVPDDGEPQHAVTAAVAAAVLATVSMLMRAASVFPAIIQRYTAPRAFARLVVEDIDRELDAGDPRLVVFRAGLLTEMLKMTIRRGDSVAIAATLEAIEDFHSSYLAARRGNPGLRVFRTDDGSERDGWLAQDLSSGLVAAGEEAVRLTIAGNDLNKVARVLAGLADGFDEIEDYLDARMCVDGLIELSTSHTQVGPGTVNVFSEPVGQLAWVEAQAEERAHGETAEHALAGWALGAAYARYHLGAEEHPLQSRSVRTFGPEPPWQGALLIIVQDHEWSRQWANKFADEQSRVDVIAEILRASEEHAAFHGNPKPDLTPPALDG